LTLRRRVIWMACAAWAEGQASGHRGDLQSAALGAAMAAFAPLMGHRHVGR
jgi:hypothetical protein